MLRRVDERRPRFILVAGEVLADTIPPARRWNEAVVGEGRRVGPYAGVEHADDDVSFQR